MIVLDTIKGAGYKPVEEMKSNHHIIVSAKFGDEAICFFEESLKKLDKDGEAL